MDATLIIQPDCAGLEGAAVGRPSMIAVAML